MAIASLVYLSKLKYAFALLLTKCDLLQPSPLYEITVQVLKAETAYDQVLAQQNNNPKVLVRKAVLRKFRKGSVCTSGDRPH